MKKCNHCSVWVILSFMLVGCTTFNPATGRNELILITKDIELSLGLKSHQQLEATMPIITSNHPDYMRLQRVGRRIAEVSDRQDYVYRFYIIDQEELNAFTTPGGRIYIYSGLLKQLNDDELASVLAHEIGHCAAKHVVKKYQATVGYQLLHDIAFGTLDKQGQYGYVSDGVNVLASLGLAAYSRQDELEADRIGLRYMDRAGFNVHAMINVFQLLEQSSDDDSQLIMLKSHPHLSDRIKNAEYLIRTKNYFLSA